MPSSAGPPRVVLLTDRSPQGVARLVTKIHEAGTTEICGLVYRVSPAGNHERPSLSSGVFAKANHALLRLAHARSNVPNGRVEFSVADLINFCQRLNLPIHIVSNWNPAEFNGFLAGADARLGILFTDDSVGPDVLKNLRFDLMTVRECAVTDERPPRDSSESPGPASKVQVRVGLLRHGAEQAVALCTASFAVEPLDTRRSLTMKATLVARDLLVQGLANYASGNLSSFHSNASVDFYAARSSFDDIVSGEQERAAHSNARTRPAWKLLLRTLMLGPFIVLRNWWRRWRGSFPVVVLYHHLVADRPHRMGISTERFLQQVQFLMRYYKLVSLTEAVALLKNGRISEPTVVLTLDDGYRDNFLTLRAVADEIGGLPATLFLCSQHLTSQEPFEHDAKRGEHSFLPLTWEQVATLQREGFEIGSHTRTHFDCGSTDREKLEGEILGSKKDLEEQLGQGTFFFSFPWGNPKNMSKPAIETARAAYRHLFSACGGENFPSAGGEFWHLKRRCHPNDLWELELTLQSALELESLGKTGELGDIFA